MSSPTAIRHLLIWARDTLIQAGVPSPQADAEWTLAHVLECPRSELHLRAHQPLTPEQNATFRNLIHCRADRIPLQHLLGNTEFYGLPFHTSPDALIPRPETETLVEIVLDQLKNITKPRILDIGTGSGIIAITLSKATRRIACNRHRYIAQSTLPRQPKRLPQWRLQPHFLSPNRPPHTLCTARGLQCHPLQPPLYSQPCNRCVTTRSPRQ